MPSMCQVGGGAAESENPVSLREQAIKVLAGFEAHDIQNPEREAELRLDALLRFLTDHRDEAEIAMHDVMTDAEERGDEIDYMQAVVGVLK